MGNWRSNGDCRSKTDVALSEALKYSLLVSYQLYIWKSSKKMVLNEKLTLCLGTQPQGIIGPPAKRHLNGVSLAANGGLLLYAFLVQLVKALSNQILKKISIILFHFTSHLSDRTRSLS